MNFALITLWHDRQRYLPGILAVAFSALLIALQFGLLLGLFSITSIPIDHSSADIWVGAPEVLSVDLGRPIPESFLARVQAIPEVEHAEVFLEGFSYWAKPGGGSELSLVIGCKLADNAIGALRELTPDLRAKLAVPGSIVVDESELDRLGIHGVGDTAEINGNRVRVVGLVQGLKSISGPYIFCSVHTAQKVMRLPPHKVTYVLARCRPGADVHAVVERLREYKSMSSFTAAEFSLRSRLHWLTKTKAGIALGFAALLGLLVGAVVTSQTLYAATAASIREYAVLQALGIPRWRMAAAVLGQSFWVGFVGVLLALPATYALASLAESAGAKVLLPNVLLLSAASVTMLMAMLSGLAALRSLRLVEPALLLR